jgi:GH25 family lysozyme M1 (1,4-beta-N-acetylmuramidase)
LWIAKYSSKSPLVGREIEMWQYTSSAIASDFYTKPLDRNYWYGEAKHTEDSGNPYPVPTRNLKRTYPMQKGNDVKWLQWELNTKGYDLEVDGKFGNDTKAAVRAYQKAFGLKVDGIVGSATRYSLLND